MVLFFDECHRSQFGIRIKTLSVISPTSNCFGFTGTPILAETQTAKKPQQVCLENACNKYVITDAIPEMKMC